MQHNAQPLYRLSVSSGYGQELKSQVCNGEVEAEVTVKVCGLEVLQISGHERVRHLPQK